MCGLIVRLGVVPRKAVVGDIDQRFDNLSGSHHQSHLNCVSLVCGIFVSGQLSRDVTILYVTIEIYYLNRQILNFLFLTLILLLLIFLNILIGIQINFLGLDMFHILLGMSSLLTTVRYNPNVVGWFQTLSTKGYNCQLVNKKHSILNILESFTVQLYALHFIIIVVIIFVVLPLLQHWHLDY